MQTKKLQLDWKLLDCRWRILMEVWISGAGVWRSWWRWVMAVCWEGGGLWLIFWARFSRMRSIFELLFLMRRSFWRGRRRLWWLGGMWSWRNDMVGRFGFRGIKHELLQWYRKFREQFMSKRFDFVLELWNISILQWFAVLHDPWCMAFWFWHISNIFFLIIWVGVANIPPSSDFPNNNRKLRSITTSHRPRPSSSFKYFHSHCDLNVQEEKWTNHCSKHVTISSTQSGKPLESLSQVAKKAFERGHQGVWKRTSCLTYWIRNHREVQRNSKAFFLTAHILVLPCL